MTATDTPEIEQGLFSAVSAVTAREPGRFDAEIDPRWTMAGKPNGGYLLAILGRAAAQLTAHGHVIAASAHYLRPPEPGPVQIATELLRSGRSASQVRARLEQGGQACVESIITASRLDPDTAPYWDLGLPERGQSDYEDSTRLTPRLPRGGRVSIMDHVEVRLDPDSRGFTTGHPTGRGEVRGWLTLPGGEDFDPASLLFAVDSFPPATFDVELTGWVPTLEMTVYVRALPVPGPVRVLQRASLIEAGRVDETCFVWDLSGRLVAQATQLAGIRLG